MPPEVANLILQRLDEIQTDNRVDHEMLRENQSQHGERITAVETSLTDLKPKVEAACKKANGATEKIAGVRGQWKVLLYFLGASCLGIVGWLLKGAFG